MSNGYTLDELRLDRTVVEFGSRKSAISHRRGTRGSKIRRARYTKDVDLTKKIREIALS